MAGGLNFVDIIGLVLAVKLLPKAAFHRKTWMA